MTINEKINREKDGQIQLPGGEIGVRDWLAEHSQTVHCPGNWPLLSDAAGVHPSQIREAEEHATRNGVPTQFTPDGRAIFTSPTHRRKYLKLIGLVDKNSYL
ncbi:MAG TPA: hypothetical protein PLX83_19330 [bacterium]|nr:hypothetical protein [bacterium]